MSSPQETMKQMRKEICELRDKSKSEVIESCIKQRLAKVDETYIHELSLAVSYLTPRVNISRLIK